MCRRILWSQLPISMNYLCCTVGVMTALKMIPLVPLVSVSDPHKRVQVMIIETCLLQLSLLQLAAVLLCFDVVLNLCQSMMRWRLPCPKKRVQLPFFNENPVETSTKIHPRIMMERDHMVMAPTFIYQKNLSHEGLTIQATVAPDSDRSTNDLLANTFETRSLPEFVAVDGTGVIAELHGRKTQRSSLQHDSSEKASHVLDEGSARIDNSIV